MASQQPTASAPLKLLKVVSVGKASVPSPFAGWSLSEGANHFEGDVPAEVAERYKKLLDDGTIQKIELLDADGKAMPWNPAETK